MPQLFLALFLSLSALIWFWVEHAVPDSVVTEIHVSVPENQLLAHKELNRSEIRAPLAPTFNE